MTEKLEQSCGTDLTGNTLPQVRSTSFLTPELINKYEKEDKKKHRSYCSGMFDERDIETIKTIDCKYLIMGNEICPITGRHHKQMYIQFKNPISKWSLQRQLPRTKLIPCAGSDLKNFKYCSKDGNLHFEKGTRPYARMTNEILKKMTNAEIIEFDHRCHRSYIHARDILNGPVHIDEWGKKVKVFYIQGPSGIGKSDEAKNIIRAHAHLYGLYTEILKFESPFYINAFGETKSCILDEFRDSDMRAKEFINFIDYNIHSMNVKGGSIKNKYELIIITTVQKISEIYHNMAGEPRKQWERRVILLDMYDPKYKKYTYSESNLKGKYINMLKELESIIPYSKRIISSLPTERLILSAEPIKDLESCNNPNNPKCTCDFCFDNHIKDNGKNCTCPKCNEWEKMMW